MNFLAGKGVPTGTLVPQAAFVVTLDVSVHSLEGGVLGGALKESGISGNFFYPEINFTTGADL